jgi:hypothetical protein
MYNCTSDKNFMGLFDLFSQKPPQPYKKEEINKIYDLLFCDNLELYRKESKAAVYPWDILLAKRPDIERLQGMVTDKTIEARIRILAYRLLSANGAPSNKKELLGVIVEVALPGGLDVVAAYSDGRARYINHSQKLIVWENETEQSRELIRQLFSNSIKVVSKIGPWDKERRPAPEKGMARLTFLVADGLYFGEGPFDVLEKDPMGGPVIQSALQLMTYLINLPAK